MSQISFLEIIIFLIPGFISIKIYRAKYPVKKRTNLEKIMWSITNGLFILFIVKLLDILFFKYKFKFSRLNLKNFLAEENIVFIILLLSVGIIIGFIRILFHKLRFYLANKFNSLSNITPDPQKLWPVINKKSNEDWAVVFVDDGSTYLGWISDYTYNPDDDNHDFVLSDAKRVDEKLNEMYKVNSVYFNTKDVKRIEFISGEETNVN